MAASDASGGIPTKNVAYRVTFAIRDINGDVVTGASGLDSEVSIDGATIADCTNEATEIATTSGIYFLDLTAAEMNGDTIALKIKSTSTDSKDVIVVLHPSAQNMDDLKTTTDAIETDTQDLQTQVGTAGAGLTDVGGMSTAMKAEVNAECDTAITDGDIATETKQDVIDGIVDSILLDTAEIGNAGAGLTDVSLGATGLTALFANAMVELSVGAPSATPTLNDVLMASYHAAVHEFEHNRTTGLRKVKNSSGTALFKAPITDDGTTTTVGKAVAP